MKLNNLIQIHKLIALFLLSLYTVSCVDLNENPPSDLSPNNFYNTVDEFDLALTGVIKALYSDWSAFDYGYDLILASGGDDIRSNADLFKDYDLLIPNDRELVTHDFWAKCYLSIANANTLIAHLPKTFNNDTQKAKFDAIEGQTRFLRAFTYFYLVRLFGEVQITNAENQNFVETLKQSPIPVVYDSIISDLKIAETKLPISFEDKGRPTLAAAKTLLAKVYLTMAGWPLNDKSKYKDAMDKAAEVMDPKFGCELEPNFADLWKQSHKLTSKEFIFTFYGSIAQGGVAGSHMDLATRYFGNGEGGWGDYFSEDRFFKAFPDGPRKDATFTSVFADGTPYYEAGKDVQPFIAKYRDGGNHVYTNSEGFRPMLRYADVLLIYAEASNQVNQRPTTEAREAVNKVRERAGLADLPRGMSFEEFDNAVFQERAWEFACEGDRWFDLVRREKVEEVNRDLHPNTSIRSYLIPKPSTEIIPGILEQHEWN